MKHSPKSIYGIGQCCMDYLARIAACPPPDSKCEASEIVTQGGGPVATALVALSRWGMNCTFAGIVGDDEYGRQIRASLNREGIDTSGLVLRHDSHSQVAFIAAEPDCGHRTIFWRRPTGAPLAPDEIDSNRIRQCAALHTDGIFPEASLRACREAQQAGAQVVVDAGSLRDGMLEIARHSDCFLASETFARSLIGGDAPLDACRKLADLGPRIVGVTLGAKGYVALEKGQVIRGKAYSVETVDTTGCGDIFHAGFIYGLVSGWPTAASLDFGAWAAAMVARQLGGRSGIPAAKDWPGERKFPYSPPEAPNSDAR
jgi:ribokinase